MISYTDMAELYGQIALDLIDLGDDELAAAYARKSYSLALRALEVQQ